MSEDMQKPTPRRYPPFWERAVPLIVAVIGIIVLGLAFVAASVALGVFPVGG